MHPSISLTGRAASFCLSCNYQLSVASNSYETRLLSTHSTNDQNWKKKKRCLMPFQSSFASMKWQVHKEFSLLLEKTQEGWLTAGEIMKASHRFNHIFQNVTAFLFVEIYPFTLLWGVFTGFHGPTYSLCNCPLGLVWFYLAGVSSQQLHNNSLRLGFILDWTKSQTIILWKNYDFFFHLQAHSASCHLCTKLCLNTTATILPSPLIPATLDRVVHNKSITHSFKMKMKRASD